MRLSGTSLEIYLKENRDTVKIPLAEGNGYNLVANADGFVDSIVVRAGTALVKVGEEVKKGDVLIAGVVKVPKEDEITEEIKFCKASGDVWMVYHFPVNEKIFLEHNVKEYTGKERKKVVIYSEKGKWGLDLRKIPFVKYDYIEENIEFPLMKFLSLPLEIKQITYRDYIIKKEKYTLKEAKEILNEKFEKIIVSLEEKGVQIIEKNVKIRANSVYLLLTGDIKIRELCNNYEYSEEIQ